MKSLVGINKQIAFWSAENIHFIFPNKVLYCHSDNGNTTLFLNDGQTLEISKTLKNIESILSNEHFFRVHRSYLINCNYLTTFHKGKNIYVELSGGIKVPVSQRKRDELLAYIGKLQSI